MTSETPSEPPEEPHHIAQPHILSPASPKPVYFPPPTTIPVLEMQMDVGFNQTELHMSDPSTRNTEVRPDFWRDPQEATTQQAPLDADPTDQASPYSTGVQEEEEDHQNGGAASHHGPEAFTAEAVIVTDSNHIASHNLQDPDSLNAPSSHDALSHLQAGGVAAYETQAISDPPSNPGAPSTSVPAEHAISRATDGDISGRQAQPAAPAFDGAIDVQALLNTLQSGGVPASPISAAAAANVPPSADGMTVTATLSPSATFHPSPSQNQSQPPPPGVDGVEGSAASSQGLGAPPSGLPPRPPPQEQPLIHPNYVHSQHIRDYHPHAANPAFHPQSHGRTGSQSGSTSGNVADPSLQNYVPPVHSPSVATAAQPQHPQYPQQSPTSALPPSLPSPVRQSPNMETQPTAQVASGAAQDPPSTSTPIESRRERQIAAGETPSAEDRPWNAEVQRKYDRFIEEERKYVSEGRWEQFPPGSRLFVGNLSSEKVTKRDIFHFFHCYGDLAQISIKQAYGFVQFLRVEDCARALEGEQGTQIREKRIHLEVSKPQKNRNQNNHSRRSRSPAVAQDSGRAKPGHGVDRYVSGSRTQHQNGRGDGHGGRHGGGGGGYGRSPTPPSRGGYRDRYDDRHRHRSRSPVYGNRHNGGGGGRFRSPSPRRNEDDDLPLPKRAPRDVPDVQIVVLDTLDRDFISWVEKAFSSRGVRVDVLLLSPRLSEQAVIRRQIVEGVIAVSKLRRRDQETGKIGLQIFDRRGGNGEVKFEEYDGLDPGIAVELVLRARMTHSTPQGSDGGYASQVQPWQQQYSGYGAQLPQQLQPPTYTAAPSAYPSAYSTSVTAPPQNNPPNLQNLITSLDPNGLQSLLSAMGTPQTAYGGTPQSAGFPTPGYGPQQHQHQQQAAIAALQQNPQAFAGLLQQQQQQQQQQQHHPHQQGPGLQQQGVAGGPSGGPPGDVGPQVNMQEILARLGTYKQ